MLGKARGSTQAEFPKMCWVETNRGKGSATEPRVTMTVTQEKPCLMSQRCTLASKTLGQRRKVLEAMHTKELILFVIDFRAGRLYI